MFGISRKRVKGGMRCNSPASLVRRGGGRGRDGTLGISRNGYKGGMRCNSPASPVRKGGGRGRDGTLGISRKGYRERKNKGFRRQDERRFPIIYANGV